nr:putative sulfate exporter family transporter [Nitratireductor luteus]
MLVCLVIAAAAQFLADHYGAPQMLFALLIGMAVHFLADDVKTAPGIGFASSTVLRIGVALLGLRITLDQISGLGAFAVVWVALGVLATILFGYALGRFTRAGSRLGVLSGASVGICGASAALAVAAIMPRDKDQERNTIFVVITVTTLSTISMIAYPILAQALGLSDNEAGLFLGGTIHDVAQVVGAGYSVSEETGNVSTVVKLFRVVLLVPVVLVLGFVWRQGEGVAAGAGKLPRVPLPSFVTGFIALVLVNSFMPLPEAVNAVLVDASRWCLVTAIAALGIKTSLQSLGEVGFLPVLMIVLETVLLAAWVLAGLAYLG